MDHGTGTNWWDAHPYVHVDGIFRKWVGGEESVAKKMIAEWIKDSMVKTVIDAGAATLSLYKILREMECDVDYMPMDYTNYFLGAVDALDIKKFFYHDLVSDWPEDAKADVVVIRHVLEHNRGWREILTHMAGAASKYLVVCNFLWREYGKTEMHDPEEGQPLQGWISNPEVEELLSELGWQVRRREILSSNDYILWFDKREEDSGASS